MLAEWSNMWLSRMFPPENFFVLAFCGPLMRWLAFSDLAGDQDCAPSLPRWPVWFCGRRLPNVLVTKGWGVWQLQVLWERDFWKKDINTLFCPKSHYARLSLVRLYRSKTLTRVLWSVRVCRLRAIWTNTICAREVLSGSSQCFKQSNSYLLHL